MPIIKKNRLINSSSLKNGLADVEYVGDKFIFTHVQNIDPIAEQCKELRKGDNNGFSDGHSYREVARIPDLVFFAHPELVDDKGRINMKELRKFLKTPAGEMYKTVENGI